MKQKRKKLKQKLTRWVHDFIIVTAIWILIFSTGIGVLIGYLRTLPPIEQLENYSPPQATSLLDRTGKIRIARMARQNREVVPLDDMPVHLKQAFISIEDKRFFRHFGVDILRTFKALLVNIKRGRRAQGASTVTQQLPRNILKNVTRKKIISRKIKETLLAFQIERRYSKDQILEFYLNQIYLGNGAYGVQAASRTFFNKDVSDLNLSEAATLAAIPQIPERYSPINNLEASTKRRNIVLRLMLEQGKITGSQYEDSISTSVLVSPPPPARNLAPYFVEYTRKRLVDTDEIDNEGLYRDGYVIHTTLDMNLQKIADEELEKGLHETELLRKEHLLKYRYADYEDQEVIPEPGKTCLGQIHRVFTDALNVRVSGWYGTIDLPDQPPYYHTQEFIKPGEWIEVVPSRVFRDNGTFFGELADQYPIQGAVVILNAKTGEIRAMCGGENFYDMENNGMWNRAAQGRGRQPGSAVKPLFFSCALESGKTLADRYNDRRIVFADGYTPHNFENIHFGWTTLEEALEHSRNVVTVLLYQDLGYRRALPFVRRFDIVEDRPEWQLPIDPTVALGSFSVTPLSLAAAYVPFVNRGIIRRPVSVTKVIGPDEKEAISIKAVEREVMTPENSAMMTYALSGVIKRGTGQSLIGDVLKDEDIPEIAGKSGTTNDCVDAWFVGFTPENVVCVWVGFDDNTPMGPRMTGSRVAGVIWREIVRRAVKLNPEGPKNFTMPGDLEFVDVCSESGKRAGEACLRHPEGDVYLKMPFPTGKAPAEICNIHR